VALERDVRRSCTAYYVRVRMLSVRVLRVLQSGAAAALAGALLAAGWLRDVRA
jgi:hypothetical protein